MPPLFFSTVRAEIAAVSGSLRNASCQSDRRGVTSAQSRHRGDKPSTCARVYVCGHEPKRRKTARQFVCVGIFALAHLRMSQCIAGSFYGENTGSYEIKAIH